MKSLNGDGNGNNNISSWLGFSLSPPHENGGFVSASTTVSSSVPSSISVSGKLLLSPTSHFSTGAVALCYGGGKSGGFHSPLSVMPLKSDDSLCIMEALSRSQAEGMVPNASPKLEDFLGSATVDAHGYGSHEREAMALSLDSVYYHHPSDEPEPKNSMDFLQEPFRSNNGQIQDQLNYHLQTLPSCHDFYQTSLGHEPKATNFNEWAVGVGQYSSQPHMTAEIVDDGGVSAIGYGNLQPLSLSMSPGSQSSCVTASKQISAAPCNRG